MGGKLRKPYLGLLGKPVLAWTLKALSAVKGLRQIVIVTRPEDRATAQAAAKQARLPRRISLAFVDGGARRQDSVLNGLKATAPQCELVLIHDAARPFPAPQAMAEACAQARLLGAAILACRVKDTVKREKEGVTRHSSPVTLETVPRQGLWLAQTPQVFRRELILELLERLMRETPGREVTDDAAVCEACGRAVALVESPQTNLKITRPEDVLLAEAYLKAGLVESRIMD
jgi:2-C-methyl-D-erythritol 4-phosphate cytidylyltransferase